MNFLNFGRKIHKNLQNLREFFDFKSQKSLIFYKKWHENLREFFKIKPTPKAHKIRIKNAKNSHKSRLNEH